MTDLPADRHVLICLAVHEGALPPVPSRWRFCADCHTPIWVSLTMLDEADRGTVEAVCGACGLDQTDHESEFFVHPRQQDLMEAYELALTERVVEVFNLRGHQRRTQ